MLVLFVFVRHVISSTEISSRLTHLTLNASQCSTAHVKILIISLLQENIQPIFYPSPGVSHHSAQQLTEDEQIKIAKRIGLIQHLPIHQYTDDNFKSKKIPSECDICMNDFVVGKFIDRRWVTNESRSTTTFVLGDSIRYLPCMHQYHVHCVDNWLMRSLTCPSCCEPVDASMLTQFETI